MSFLNSPYTKNELFLMNLITVSFKKYKKCSDMDYTTCTMRAKVGTVRGRTKKKRYPYKKGTTNPEVMLDGSLIWIKYLDQNNIGNETLICAGTYKWFLYWNLYGVCFVCSPFHIDNNKHFRVTVFICIITSVLFSSRGTTAAYMFTRISFITEYDSNLCRGMQHKAHTTNKRWFQELEVS